MTGQGAFQANISGLTALTTYYYIAAADGGAHGSDHGYGVQLHHRGCPAIRFHRLGYPGHRHLGHFARRTAGHGYVAHLIMSRSSGAPAPAYIQPRPRPRLMGAPADFTATLSGFRALLPITTGPWPAEAGTAPASGRSMPSPPAPCRRRWLLCSRYELDHRYGFPKR